MKQRKAKHSIRAASAESQHMQTIDAVVLRCNCGNPHSHPGVVCPKAVKEIRGNVSYNHPSWLMRWRFRRAIRLAEKLNMVLVFKGAPQ